MIAIGSLLQWLTLIGSTMTGSTETSPPTAAHAAASPGSADSIATTEQETPGVRAGSFPGSIQIPGTDLSIKFGGFVKLDLIHDFDAIGDTDAFKTSSIPVPEQSSDGNTRLHAKETRLNLDARTTTGLGDFRVFVEGDFFGSGDTFRLRHAYGELGEFLGGQTWTNFMDIDSRPDTLDYEGPDGSVFLRQAQARWTKPLGEDTQLRLALEQPDADLTAPTGAIQETVLPDLTAGFHLHRGRCDTYLSGIARQIGYEASGISDEVFGWGLNLSGILKTWGKDDFRYQIAYGEGIASYIEDFRGLGANAAPDASGDLEALPVLAGFLAYRHLWSEEFRSNLVYSYADIDNSAGQPGDAINQTDYVAVNLIWSPIKSVDVGGEYLYGNRENQDGQSADANRVQFSAKWSF